MKILMLSRDPTVLEESDARSRMLEYGALVEELHVIVCARSQNSGKEKQVIRNVFFYRAASRGAFRALWRAYRMAGCIIRDHLASRAHVLITCQDPFETGMIGYFLKRKFGVRLQLQVHTDFFSPFFRKESLKNKIRVLLATFLLPKADCIRVVSERIKKSLLYSTCIMHHSRITVLPIFVDAEKIKRAPITINLRQRYPQFKFILFMASRITREKNVDLALRAMRKVIRYFPKTGLVIVGEGPERKAVELRMKHYGLRSNVILEDPADFETLISCYKTADLFLLTSDYEGYGRTVVEAIAAGLPVVMTDVGIAGHEIVSGKNGIIVPVGDCNGVRDALLKILRDPLLFKRLKDGAAATAAGVGKAHYLTSMKHAWEHCSA